jgi:hypothetical protein
MEKIKSLILLRKKKGTGAAAINPFVALDEARAPNVK